MEDIDARLRVLEEATKNLKERLDKLEDTHLEDFETVKEQFQKDYQKLLAEFNELRKEYEVSKIATDKDLSLLKDVPALLQSLKETIQEINTVLTTTKTDLEEVQKALALEKDRGKFDIVAWVVNNVVPALLTGGVIYFILHTIGAI